MAYSAVPTVITGDPWTAGNNNTYIRDNFKAGIPDIFTAAGDIAYATGANVAVPLPIGDAMEKLYTNAAGTAPEWRGWVGCILRVDGTFAFDDSKDTVPTKTIFDTEVFDPDGMWTDIDPDAVTVPYDGVYHINGTIFIKRKTTSGFTAEDLQIWIGPDDKLILTEDNINSNPSTSISYGYTFDYVGYFNANDDVYMRASVYNSAGFEKFIGTGTIYNIRYLGAST